MPFHTVRQGECVSSIAFKAGLLPDVIWGHPENADLNKKRRDGHVLFPGDILFVPEKDVSQFERPTDAQHKFVMKNSKVTLSVRFLRDESPAGAWHYTISVDGMFLRSGDLDGDGALSVRIPADSKRAIVTLQRLNRRETYVLQLGHLDPVDESSGVRWRLSNLGYLNIKDDSDGEVFLSEAIKSFQLDQGLPSGGGLDKPTRDRLKVAHGS